MIKKINLEDQHLQIISSILNSHLPKNAKIWMFGSRVVGKAKPFSDIDLLIDLGKPAPLSLIGKLNLAFEESELPYKVDLADASTITHEFKQKIKDQLVVFPLQ
jgi:predicted nucleotidyltransferase